MTPEEQADRLALLKEQTRRGDIDAVRRSYQRGDLGWLSHHLGADRYGRLSTAIESGNLDAIGTELGTVDETTLMTSSGVGGPLVDPLSPAYDDPALIVSRGGSVLPVVAVRRERNTLIAIGVAIALAAAALIAFLVIRNNDDNSDATLTPVPVVQTSIVESTLVETSLVESTLAPSTEPVVVATSPAPPIRDVIDTANASGTFGPFLSLIEAAGLTQELRLSQPTTVFAPTESAFTSLPSNLQIALRSPANRQVLARIVRYHVLAQSLRAVELTPGQLQTVEGSRVTVRSVNGTVHINDALVTGPDVATSTGILHAIDKLLLPPGIDLVALSTANTGPIVTVTPASPPATTAAKATVPTTAAKATVLTTASAKATVPATVPATTPATVRTSSAPATTQAVTIVTSPSTPASTAAATVPSSVPTPTTAPATPTTSPPAPTTPATTSTTGTTTTVPK